MSHMRTRIWTCSKWPKSRERVCIRSSMHANEHLRRDDKHIVTSYIMRARSACVRNVEMFMWKCDRLSSLDFQWIGCIIIISIHSRRRSTIRSSCVLKTTLTQGLLDAVIVTRPACVRIYILLGICRARTKRVLNVTRVFRHNKHV